MLRFCSLATVELGRNGISSDRLRPPRLSGSCSRKRDYVKSQKTPRSLTQRLTKSVVQSDRARKARRRTCANQSAQAARALARFSVCARALHRTPIPCAPAPRCSQRGLPSCARATRLTPTPRSPSVSPTAAWTDLLTIHHADRIQLSGQRVQHAWRHQLELGLVVSLRTSHPACAEVTRMHLQYSVLSHRPLRL